MNGIDYLADTNAVLYFLSGNRCMEPFVSCKYAVSVISEMELLSYPKLAVDEEKQIKGFLKNSKSVFITNEIKNKTIQIRRQYNIKLPDAIISATAIVNDWVLITADIGFRKIKELKLQMITPEINSDF